MKYSTRKSLSHFKSNLNEYIIGIGSASNKIHRTKGVGEDKCKEKLKKIASDLENHKINL